MIKHPDKYQDFEDPQARPRYTGIASFFRAPASEQAQDVDIGIIGVPFDGGVTNRSGTRHGPRAVREQSTMLRRINAESSISSTRKGGWPALSGEIESLLIALLRAMSAHGSLRDATH